MEISARPVPDAADVRTVGELDADVETLRAHADAWARLGIAGKIRHLRAMRTHTIEVAQRWVDLAVDAKGIRGSQLAGEEWLSGPYALLTALDRLTATLGGIAINGAPPIPERAIRTRAGGQVVVDVFPVDNADRILLNGLHAEIWMDPAVTRDTLHEHTASFYKRVEPDGFVTLVLGAGNIASIPPLDVLTALYAHGSVALLKLNPVNGYLLPVFARIFSSLIGEGFVRLAGGGADVGAYLCAHPGIDAIHLTGGERTHDAIVFGGGDDGAARKRAGAARRDETRHERIGQRDAGDRRTGAVGRSRPEFPRGARRHAEAAQRRRELHRRASRGDVRGMGPRAALLGKSAHGAGRGAGATVVLSGLARTRRHRGARAPERGVRRHPDRRHPPDVRRRARPQRA